MKSAVLTGSVATLLIAANLSFGQAAAPSRFQAYRQMAPTRFERIEADPRRVAAPLVAVGPEIDGQLNDGCWKVAGVAAPLVKCDDGIAMDIPADLPTSVSICRDAKNLYFGWRITGEREKQLAQKPRYGQPYNWREPPALVLLQPPGVDDWFGWYFNPDGAGATRSQRADYKHQAGFRLAVAPSADGMTAELAIPLDSPGLHVPQEGQWWRLQLGRVSSAEWSAWSNSRGAHENPSRFGYLYFGTPEALATATVPLPVDLEFYGESRRYRKDEQTTQFVVNCRGFDVRRGKLKLTLSRADGVVVEEAEAPALEEPKLAWLLDLRGLEAGQYVMKATCTGATAEPLQATWPFEITAETTDAIAVPEQGVELKVHEQAHVPNGSWPITTGVPLPYRAVYDAATLGVYENGQRIAANVIPLATWKPSREVAGEAGLDHGGLRWVSVSFVARYDGGKPRKYVVKPVGKEEPAPASPLTLSESGNQLVIRTGPAQLVINRSSFDGIHGAWLDANGDKQFSSNEQIILPGGGPFLFDQQDRRYEARHRARSGDTNVQVTVEERGPARIVVAAKGWYHTAEGKPLCQYHTRIIAYAGLATFRVQQRTIVTYDTRTNRLGDLGFRLPAREPVWAYFEADAVEIPAQPQPDSAFWSTSIHQDRSDHFRIIHDRLAASSGQRAIVSEVGQEGRRSDGSVQYGVDRSGLGMQVTLKDVWQKFPKELEAGKDGLTLHFWPAHGGDTFSDQEELSRANVHKLYWAHEGKFLDMQIPARYRDRLHEICRTDWFGLQESVEVGYGSNGIGTAIANEFVVTLKAARGEPSAPTPALVQQDPHAVADPAYACATNALERIHPQDAERFGPLERLLEKGYLARTRFFDEAEEWGMWNYADLHTYSKPYFLYPNLHRVWLASHYRNVQTAWLMYFRSGSPGWLAWARAYSDHFMNVDMCHFAPLDEPVIGTDPEGKRLLGYVIHIPGAMMHCKGFAHWTSDLNAATHFIDPDPLLWRYYLTGDYAYRDAYDLWAAALGIVALPRTADRETNNTLAAILARYTHGWDPQLLLQVHRMGDVLTSAPLASHQSGCMWNVFWMDRYYRLTADDRIIERAKEFLSAQPGSPREDLTYATFASLLYELTGDKSYVTAAMEDAWRKAHAMYLNPADPLDGWPALPPIAGGNFAYTAAPRWMRAMAEAGVPFQLTAETCILPGPGIAFQDPAGGNANIEVLLVHDPTHDATLRFQYYSAHPVAIRLFDPAGKKVAEQQIKPGRYYGDSAPSLTVGKDQPAGLYRLVGNVHLAAMRMPLGDAVGEAAVIRPGRGVKVEGLTYHLAPSQAHAGPLLLEIGQPVNYGGEGPTIVQVQDAKGELLLDSSVAGELQRPSVQVRIDPAQTPPPWRLFVAAEVTLQLHGNAPLLASPTAAKLEAVVKALAAAPKEAAR